MSEWIEAVGMMHAAACPTCLVDADDPMAMAREVVAEVAALRARAEKAEREVEGLRLAVGDYHVQRGAPSWKPQCQIDLEQARESNARLREIVENLVSSADHENGWLAWILRDAREAVKK